MITDGTEQAWLMIESSASAIFRRAQENHEDNLGAIIEHAAMIQAAVVSVRQQIQEVKEKKDREILRRRAALAAKGAV